MDKAAQLREQITKQSPHASRELVVEYLKLLAATARATPVDILESRGNYVADKKFPQTVGEDVASEISSCLAWQDWINEDNSPELEEIGSLAGQLERSTNNHELWQELLNHIDKL